MKTIFKKIQPSIKVILASAILGSIVYYSFLGSLYLLEKKESKNQPTIISKIDDLTPFQFFNPKKVFFSYFLFVK